MVAIIIIIEFCCCCCICCICCICICICCCCCCWQLFIICIIICIELLSALESINLLNVVPRFLLYEFEFLDFSDIDFVVSQSPRVYLIFDIAFQFLTPFDEFGWC